MYDKQVKAKLAHRNKERNLQNENPDKNCPLPGERKNRILLLNLVNTSRCDNTVDVSNITWHSSMLTKYPEKLNPTSSK